MRMVTSPGRANADRHPRRTQDEPEDRTARTLAAACDAGPEERNALLNEVICLNMGVARSVAARYFNRGVDHQDLTQVAYVALTRAAHNYRPEQHTDFLAYAVPTISGELKKYFRDRAWTIRPTRTVQESQARITRAEADLVQSLGRSPRVSELAEATGLDLALVEEALAVNGCFAPRSLDMPVGHSDGAPDTIADHLPAESHDHEAVEARVLLAGVVGTLSARDRLILRMRFFEDRTQQEIADDVGLTQMQVSRLLTRMMRDLRREIVGEAAPVGHPERALLA